MLEKVFAHWDRLRLYYFKDVSKQRTKEAQAEHKLLLKALEKRDPNEVEQIIRKHNQSALKSYIHHLELQGLITITED
jgi:DNA-binding GntR family transcriptional regulator